MLILTMYANTQSLILAALLAESMRIVVYLYTYSVNTVEEQSTPLEEEHIVFSPH